MISIIFEGSKEAYDGKLDFSGKQEADAALRMTGELRACGPLRIRSNNARVAVLAPR